MVTLTCTHSFGPYKEAPALSTLSATARLLIPISININVTRQFWMQSGWRAICTGKMFTVTLTLFMFFFIPIFWLHHSSIQCFLAPKQSGHFHLVTVNVRRGDIGLPVRVGGGEEHEMEVLGQHGRAHQGGRIQPCFKHNIRNMQTSRILKSSRG